MAVAQKQKNCAGLRQVAIAGSALAGVFCVGQTWAQESGAKFTVTVSPGIEVVNETGRSSDRDDEGTNATTGLSLGFESQTRAQSLSFGLDTDFAYNFSDSEGLETGDTRAQLGYQRSNTRSEFRFGSRYRRSEIDDTVFDEVLDEDIIVGTGTRENIGFNTGLTLGKDAPLGFSLDYSLNQSNFSDTTDASLVDSETQRLSGQLSFQISPVLTSTLSFSRRERDEEGSNGTDNVRNNIDLSSTYAITKSTQIQAGISYNDSESTASDTGIETASNGGLGFSLGATHDRPNGQLSASFASTETINGTREQFSFGRSVNFPRADISLSVGATRLDGGDFEPLANASIGFEVDALSSLSLSLSQSPDVSNDDLESIRTRFAVSYSRELSSVSSLSASLQIASRDEMGVGASDESSARLSLQYRRALDRDWDLLSGYSFSRSQEDGLDDRDVSRLFLGVERRFEFLR